MLTLLALLAPTALAGGYYYPDSGIVANGRGCTFVAGGDTYFAQYYNPAALSNIDRPQLSLGVSGIKQAVTFSRWEDPPPFEQDGQLVDPDPFFFDTVENEGKMFLVPELGGAVPIGDTIVVSAGFTSGFAPDYVFPADGPQRYTIIDNLIWNFQIGPAVAWQPKPWITVGAGLEWQVMRVEEQLKVTTSGRDDPSGDVMVVARVWDEFTPSWNAGVLITPIAPVSIGLSFQPGVDYVGTGDGYLDFTGHGLEPTLDQTRWEDDDITLALDMPAFLRAGVAYRPLENLEIETDFVYETWSKLEDIVVSDIDVTITGGNGLVNEPVEEKIPLPASFDDVWSVRLGAEYQPIEQLEVRAGGFYEDTSLTRQNVSVALVDTPKVQAGVGATWYFGRFALDGYASKVFYETLEIRDSDVTQINVFDPSTEAVVGNGDLSSSGLAVGVAGRIFFGETP